MNRKPQTDQELLDALAALLAHDDPNESIEQVDEELRAADLDPDALGSRFAKLAEDAYRESPHNWRQRARGERIRAEGKLREHSNATSRLDRDVLIERITVIVERSRGLRAAPSVQAHFRNFDRASDEDLADLLTQLEFLERENTPESDD